MGKKKKKQTQQGHHVVMEMKKPAVPYVLRQVESIQKRARLKCSVPVEQIYPVKVLPKTQEAKVIANGMELKTVSSIRQMGYTVTMAREKRWELLKNVIIPKVGKDEVIRHIKFLITMNQGQPNKLGAVYEWEYDLERIAQLSRIVERKKDKNRVNKYKQISKKKRKK